MLVHNYTAITRGSCKEIPQGSLQGLAGHVIICVVASSEHRDDISAPYAL